jgi:hypothetical protein
MSKRVVFPQQPCKAVVPFIIQFALTKRQAKFNLGLGNLQDIKVKKK